MDDRSLTIALCELIADRTGWAWRLTGPAYTTAEVGIFYGPIGSTPDRAVGVTLYGNDDDIVTGLAVRRAQFRFRGARSAPDGADVLAQPVFDALHGLQHAEGIALIERVLVARLGADGNARQERADSYQITLDNPEASA